MWLKAASPLPENNAPSFPNREFSDCQRNAAMCTVINNLLTSLAWGCTGKYWPLHGCFVWIDHLTSGQYSLVWRSCFFST